MQLPAVASNAVRKKVLQIQKQLLATTVRKPMRMAITSRRSIGKTQTLKTIEKKPTRRAIHLAQFISKDKCEAVDGYGCCHGCRQAAHSIACTHTSHAK